METVVANLTSKVRREKLNGREYLVAPSTLIVPGVLNGSNGPLYYPPSEVARNPQAWNAIPIVVYHPTDNQGRPVTARSPRVLEAQGVGYVYESTYNGKHVAEAWFDEAAVLNYDQMLRRDGKPEVHPRLMRGEPIELSTGLYTENEKAPDGFLDHHGQPYQGMIARNYVPDHLAVLPDQKGACSLRDGCGVNVVNAEDASAASLMDELSDLIGVNVAGQVKSRVTGWFKKMGAGTGAGPTHTAAQKGAMVLSDEDRELGAIAATELAETGHNPASWVADESKWERAKTAADEGGYAGDSYWAVVSHIYRNMGGTKKAKTDNEELADNAAKKAKEKAGAGFESDEQRRAFFGLKGVHGGGKKHAGGKDAKGGAGKSGGLKIEDAPENERWAGKFKVGDKHFSSKKDAESHIKKVGELAGKKDMDIEGYHSMPKEDKHLWSEIHLPGYKEASITGAPGKSEREQLVSEFTGKLRMDKSEKDQLRPDGTKKNVFDYWAESAKEWEDAARKGRTHNHDLGSTKTHNSSEDLDMANRNDNIQFLVANCDCWKGKEKVLANKDAFTDDDLAKLRTNTEQSREAVLTVNAIREEFDLSDIAANEMPAALKKAKKKPAECDDDEPVANKAPRTLQEWEASMPAEAKTIWNSAKRVDETARKERVRQLVANVKDPAKQKAMATRLLAKPLEELDELVSLLPPVTVANSERTEPVETPWYLGAAGGATTLAVNEEDDAEEVAAMTPPVINWAEEVKRRTQAV